MGVFSLHRIQCFYLFKRILKLNPVISRSVELAHKVYGPNPLSSTPILVLHGFLGSKRNWDSMSKMLTASTNTSVIAVDARNHGDSPHSSSHTYLDLATDVSKLITSLSLSQVVIIGHSMGGRTGMTLALTEPSKVAKLVVVDISPKTKVQSLNDFFPRLLAIMKSVNFEGLDNAVKAKNAAKAKIEESGLVQNMEGMHFILMNIGKTADNSFGWKCNIDTLLNHCNEIASFPNHSGKTYEGPTLFIGGQESYHLPPSDKTSIQQLFPKASLVYVSGAGHNVHAEKPKEFFDLVINFLSAN